MPLKTFGEFIRRHVLNNATAKLMALAMAVVLWLYAYISSYTSDSTVIIPIKVQTSEGWSVVHGESLEVEAQWRYPRRLEEEVRQALRDNQIYIDCSVPAGQSALDQQSKTVSLQKEPLVTPRDFSLQVMNFKPAELQIELIRETVQNVRVQPKTSAPPQGYRVEYAFPIPPTVRVRSGEKLVASLARTGIETEEIDISSAPPVNLNTVEWDSPIRFPSTVTLDGVSYPVACLDPVHCSIRLVRIPTERTFTAVPIGLLQPPGYAYVATLPESARTAEVVVSGPKSIIDALTPDNISLYVDVRDPKLAPQETRYTQPVQAQIVGVPGAGDVIVKPSVRDCAVKISDAKKSP